jgi:voltage-gated potassium channel
MQTLLKRLSTGLLVLAIVMIGGACGYYFIGGGKWKFFDCLYMTVITITTVGYGETLKGMEEIQAARLFTMVLLVFGTGSIVFFASMITAFIVEGDLKQALFSSKIKKRIKRMQGHIVVCGAGSTGRNVIEELLRTDQQVIAVDMNEAELKDINDKFPKAQYSYLVGDATDDDILAQVNLSQAKGLVAALSSDKDNLYLSVAGRQANPGLRIVARCAEISHVEKIKRAGADAVVSPNFIGGMRLVSEMVRPAVVGFLDAMLREKRVVVRIEEVALDDGVTKLGTTLRDMRIREKFGMTVLAIRSQKGEYIYNPDANEKLAPGMTLVVLGSPEQVSSLRKEMA